MQSSCKQIHFEAEEIRALAELYNDVRSPETTKANWVLGFFWLQQVCASVPDSTEQNIVTPTPSDICAWMA